MSEELLEDSVKTVDIPEDPHYVAENSNGWGIEMLGIQALDIREYADYAGTFGLPMTNFTIEASGIKKARVFTTKRGWCPYKTGFDKKNGLNEDGSAILKIELVGAGFRVAAHIKGGSWLTPITTSDIEGSVSIGMGSPIDAIWIEKIK